MTSRPARMEAVDPSFNALAEGWDLLTRFLAADPRTGDQAERLRQAYCEICRGTPDLAQRWQLCQQERCGLTRPLEFEREQAFLGTAFKRLYPLELATQAEKDSLNDHIRRAGCATVALVPDSQGRDQLGYAAHSLRAALHGTILHILAYLAGYLGTIHTRGVAPEALRDAVRLLRGLDDRRIQREVRRRAAEGVPLARLAKQFGVKDTRTVRAMINGDGKWAGS